MKKILAIIGLSVLLIACTQTKSEEGSLTGIIENIKDGTILKLIDFENDTVFRNLSVINGKFQFNYCLTKPKLFEIWAENPKYEKDKLFIWLENSDIEIRGNYYNLSNSKVEGSALNKIHEQFVSLVKKFENRLPVHRMPEDCTGNTDKILREYRNEKIRLYSKYISSEVAIYNLVNETIFNSILTKNDIKDLYNKLPIKLKHSKKGTLLKEYISLPDAPKVGDRFIDCTQLTPEMKSESISDNLGKKFTIIEFWASWCGSCRRDHPIMRKMYNLYHKKGLNIISISCDENTERWKNAIKQDCIPWNNISDLKGWYNKAFMIYGIKGVPQMILLDNNGIIVDDNFANWSMESELSKRFNKTDPRGGITVIDGKKYKWLVPNSQIK